MNQLRDPVYKYSPPILSFHFRSISFNPLFGGGGTDLKNDLRFLSSPHQTFPPPPPSSSSPFVNIQLFELFERVWKSFRRNGM